MSENKNKGNTGGLVPTCVGGDYDKGEEVVDPNQEPKVQ
jgi:hypothetical protein